MIVTEAGVTSVTISMGLRAVFPMGCLVLRPCVPVATMETPGP